MQTEKSVRKLATSKALTAVIKELKGQPSRLNVCGVKVNIQHDMAHGLGRRSSHLLRRGSKDLMSSLNRSAVAEIERKMATTASSNADANLFKELNHQEITDLFVGEDAIVGWDNHDLQDKVLEDTSSNSIQRMFCRQTKNSQNTSPQLKIEKYREFVDIMKSENCGDVTKDKVARLALKCMMLEKKVSCLEEAIRQSRVNPPVQRSPKKCNTFAEGMVQSPKNNQTQQAGKQEIIGSNKQLFNSTTNLHSKKHKFRGEEDHHSYLELSGEVQKLRTEMSHHHDRVRDLECQLREKQSLISRLEHALSRSECCQQAVEDRNVQLETDMLRLRQRAAEMEYEMTCKKELSSKLADRNHTIATLEEELERVRIENVIQREKLNGYYNQFYCKIVKEKYLIEGIDEMVREAESIQVKMLSALEELIKEGRHSEKLTYLKHLFFKNEELTNGVLTELRMQLQALDSERNGYNQSLQRLKLENTALLCQREDSRTMYSSCQQRFEKYLRQMHRINVKNCISCNEFLGYAIQVDRILRELTDTIFR